MDATLVTMLVTSALAVLVVVAWATRATRDPAEPGRWARAHGVALTPANEAFVAYFVPLIGVMRVVGGVGGLVLGPLFDRAVGARTTVGFGFWAWIVAGWVLGAGLADRQVGAFLRGGGASLTARRLSDYLPAGLRWAPAAGAGLTVLLAVALPGAAPAAGPYAAVGATGPTTLDRVATVAVAVAAAGLVRLAQRGVVGRPQPADDPDLLAADDAVRATTVHHLGGGGTALTLFLAADLVGAALEGPSGAGPAVLYLVTALGALVTWRVYAFRAWRVRRPDATGPLVGARS